MKKYVINPLFIFIINFFLLCSCEKSQIAGYLVDNDNLVFTDSRITFTASSFYHYNGFESYLELSATVNVPSDVIIKDYGFCWIISTNIERSPNVYDNKKSFGSTDLKSFSYSTEFRNEPYMFYGEFYFRAYIIVDKGVIYDTFGYHKW